MTSLPRSFFLRPTLQVARELLGCEFVFGECSGIIVETEAYVGSDDPACHAAHGMTKRNEVMWGDPGYAYVYFTYGMHYCLNVVTEKNGFPAAVLLRAVIPVKGVDVMRLRRENGPDHKKTVRKHYIPDQKLTDGPAKICEAFGIDLRHNGMDVCNPDGSMFLRQARKNIIYETTPRIGIREGRDRQWRFRMLDKGMM